MHISTYAKLNIGGEYEYGHLDRSGRRDRFVPHGSCATYDEAHRAAYALDRQLNGSTKKP